MISRNAREFVWFIALALFAVAIAHAGSSTPTAARGSLGQDPLPEVSLMLTSNGFNPTELRPPSRRFLLSIDNRSGVSDLVLRLNRADGSQVRELHVSGAGGDWSESFDLSADTYSLSEANHSSWVCTMIVQ